jgi:hypothetical protein
LSAEGAAAIRELERRPMIGRKSGERGGLELFEGFQNVIDADREMGICTLRW